LAERRHQYNSVALARDAPSVVQVTAIGSDHEVALLELFFRGTSVLLEDPVHDHSISESLVPERFGNVSEGAKIR
jgi:hypothetical protein